jgi:putative membrane protein
MRIHSLTVLAGSIGIAVCLTIPPALAAQSQDAQAVNGNSGKSMSAHDQKFVKEAAIGGMYEVQAGQIAAQKATSPEAKQMAQHIVADHTQANEKLMAIAQAKGIQDLPAEVDIKHKKKLEHLNKLSGAQFDREYSKMMVSDHKADIKAFEKEATTGTDPELKQFASTTLPTLNQHLSMAQSGTHAATGTGQMDTTGDQSATPSSQAPARKNNTQ